VPGEVASRNQLHAEVRKGAVIFTLWTGIRGLG
jgi:hypothetical protein